MDIALIVFYSFAAFLLASACGVIFARSAINAVLCLILSFISAAGLWLLLHAEFLALALVFVYVGAVMTLFLFVVMMLNVQVESRPANWVRYMPVTVALGAGFVFLLWQVIGPDHFGLAQIPALLYPDDYNNVKSLGAVLYTDYVVPLELASAVLLVAMVSAISLAFRGFQKRKVQDVVEQVLVTKSERLRIVKMRAEMGGEDD